VTEFSSTAGHDEASAAAPRIKAECAEVIAEVWTLLDGECTPETREKLRKHLEECPPCLRLYGLEERIKALIARKCRGEKAPEHLRERLLLEISRTTIIRGQASRPS
jgi:mycothiol system anti-sigma-R factor